MTTALIDPARIKKYPIICMNQQWCDDFDLAGVSISNECVLRDGDLIKDKWSYVTHPDETGDALGVNAYCGHITDAQLDTNAIPIFYDADDATINLFVLNFRGGADQRKAFCGIMGAQFSMDTNGTTVQNWTAWMKDKFDKLCRWVATSDERLI
jgi:hypothetical protein